MQLDHPSVEDVATEKGNLKFQIFSLVHNHQDLRKIDMSYLPELACFLDLVRLNLPGATVVRVLQASCLSSFPQHEGRDRNLACYQSFSLFPDSYERDGSASPISCPICALHTRQCKVAFRSLS